jgi:hypothetical protein
MNQTRLRPPHSADHVVRGTILPRHGVIGMSVLAQIPVKVAGSPGRPAFARWASRISIATINNLRNTIGSELYCHAPGRHEPVSSELGLLATPPQPVEPDAWHKSLAEAGRRHLFLAARIVHY